MRHTTSAGTFLFLAILTCYLQARGGVTAAPDEPPIKADDSTPQMDVEMSKRDWNKNLNMWGKRSWQSLHGGWGLKRDSGAWDNRNDAPFFDEKRGWRNLQGAWGKRVAPDDEYALQQLLAWLEEQQQPIDNTPDYILEMEPNHEVKRGWRQFNEGWGKRGDTWRNFKGSWGKREPKWNNLKGIWGKRSYMENSFQ